MGCFALAIGLPAASFGQEKDAIGVGIVNGQTRIDLPLLPGIDQYRVWGASDLNVPFNVLNSGTISGFTWTGPLATQQFYTADGLPMSQEAAMRALVLNRLAYGPTPDELERITAIGVNAWIAEQLAPETITENLAIDAPGRTGTGWERVVMTGIPTGGTLPLYIYLSAPGDVYIDDIKLVRGTTPDAGANLLVNPGFENGLSSWTVSPNMINSVVQGAAANTGAMGLHVIATEAGTTQASSIWQSISGLSTTQPYTLSYYWRPGANNVSGLTLRLSGNGIVSTAESTKARLEGRFATTDELRAWHVLHAIHSKKQLQETLLQWLENHFVTQVSKSRDWIDRYIPNEEIDAWGGYFEFSEIEKWRAALNNPQCTFNDLLTISAESPAMIIYLDTVGSRGNGSNTPNENYARELLELFTFGVDNGYDQNDIVLMSRPWTGWSVEIVETNQANNPLALRSTTLREGGTDVGDRGDLAGVWAFNYKPNNHWTRSGTVLFPGKTIPARFGQPHAGRSYEFSPDFDYNPGWQEVVVTGTATSSTLYLYMNVPGDVYIDDMRLVAGGAPNPTAQNRIRNGGFESALTTSDWTISANHLGTEIVNTGTRSGNGALHLMASERGATRDSSVWQGSLGLTSGQQYTLSFWWKPGSTAGQGFTARMSGNWISAVSPARNSGNGLVEGYRVIDHLADLPFTQEFISVKLCRLFVHEDFRHHTYLDGTEIDYTAPNLSPEAQLVKDCMAAWENNTPKGQIRKVLEVIFNSELFRSQGAVSHKVKTPFEFTVSAIRALKSDNTDGTSTVRTDGRGFKAAMERMGAMKLFDRAEPDGYPEDGVPWISAGALAERLRFIQSLCMAAGASGRDIGGIVTTDPVGLLRKKIPAQMNNAGAVADYFLRAMFPGEGRANLDLYRTAAMNFLNTAENGSSSPLSGVVSTTTPYDTRIRGLVSALMTSPRFNEQ